MPTDRPILPYGCDNNRTEVLGLLVDSFVNNAANRLDCLGGGSRSWLDGKIEVERSDSDGAMSMIVEGRFESYPEPEGEVDWEKVKERITSEVEAELREKKFFEDRNKYWHISTPYDDFYVWGHKQDLYSAFEKCVLGLVTPEPPAEESANKRPRVEESE